MKNGAGKSGKTERKIVAPFSDKNVFSKKETRSKTGFSRILGKFLLLVYIVRKTRFFGVAKRSFFGGGYCHFAATPGPGSPLPMKNKLKKSKKPSRKLKKTPKKLKKTSKKLKKTSKKL